MTCEECAGEDSLAIGHERDIDRVVHAAGHHGLETSAIWPAAEDVRGFARPFVAVDDVRLFGERAFAPVDPAVRSGVGAVQIVRTAGKRAAFEPFDALVGDAVAIFVGEFPNAGRGGDVERAVEEQRAFREHHVVGEDGALVELAVAIGVFKPNDAMRLLFELLLHWIVRAGRLGHIEPAFIIKRRDNRPLDERRPGSELDRKPGRHIRKRRRSCGRSSMAKTELSDCKPDDASSKQWPESSCRKLQREHDKVLLEYNVALRLFQPLSFDPRAVSRKGARRKRRAGLLLTADRRR